MEPLPLSETVPDDDYLLFTPVPVKARHNGWTPLHQRAFVIALSHIGNVKLAAASVGRTRQSAYSLRKRKDAESFARAWDRALECGRHNVLDISLERALYGEERPVFYQGRQVGTTRKFDNAILRTALATLDRKVEKSENKAESTQ